ncbi:MAG TPA: thioesterase family protein [Candidatus Polarisedimenticolia bacterium]|nr:thioesterase family protein [Candidatus Polarisedimenticolia bacterium]
MKKSSVAPDDAVQVRVRYPEVDRMGVAHHTNHFVWFEVGRTELMRRRGLPYARMEEDGFLLPVIEASCSYRAPARYDDLLLVRTEIGRLSPVRFTFSYRIEREVDGVLLATGSTTHAVIGPGGRPRRLPAAILGILG